MACCDAQSNPARLGLAGLDGQISSSHVKMLCFLIYVIFGVSQRRSHQSNYHSNMFHTTLLFLPEVFPGSTVPQLENQLVGW